MSISSTYKRVAHGSAVLTSVHARTQSAAEVGHTARSISPVENIMRGSPSHLTRKLSPPSGSTRPCTAGCAQPFTSPSAVGDRLVGGRTPSVGGAAGPTPMIPLRPTTADSNTSTAARFAGAQQAASPRSVYANVGNGRPSTAYAPRRAAQLAAVAGAAYSADGDSAARMPRRPITAGANRLPDRHTPPRHSLPSMRGGGPDAWASPPTVLECGSALRAAGLPSHHANSAHRDRNGSCAVAMAGGYARGGRSQSLVIPEMIDGDDEALEYGEGHATMYGGVVLGEGAMMADDVLMGELEGAYDRLREGAISATVADETPAAAVYRLRAAVAAAQEGSCSDDVGAGQEQHPLPPLLSSVADPSVLLLWTWSYVEDDPWPFMQAVKGQCGVGEDMAKSTYAQCEAIVRGLLGGDLAWDVPTLVPQPSSVATANECVAQGHVFAAQPVRLGGGASSSASRGGDRVEAFMTLYVGTFAGHVLGAVRRCCEERGVAWCEAAEALWSCALLHLRVALDVQI